MYQYTKIVPFLLLAVLLGCEPDGIFDREVEFTNPTRLENGLALQESLNGGVIFLEVTTNDVAPRQLFVPEDGEMVLSLFAGPQSDAATDLFVMTSAEDSRETEIVETLHRVVPGTEEIVEYSIGSVFGGHDFSPDGRFLVLYHQTDDSSIAGGLFNPNEVAIVDLSEPPGDSNPNIVSIGLGGRTVESIFFPQAIQVAGVERQPVVFGARGMIKVVDLLDPADGTMSAKLVADDDPRNVIPSKVVSRPGDEHRDPMILVLATGSQDLYGFSLIPESGNTLGFTATLSQYDGGQAPSDFLLLEDGESLMLLVAQMYQDRALLIDVDTAAMYTITLEDEAPKLFLREQDGEEEAILYGPSTSYVHFLKVDGVAEEKGSNLDPMLIPDGVGTSSFLDQNRMVVVPQYVSGLALVDLSTKEVTRLTSDASFDPQETLMHNDVFFLGDNGDDQVISLDLRTGHPEPLVLDEPVWEFQIFPAFNVGFVLHKTDSGRGTLFPLDNPTRLNAVVFDGLWLEGLLDRKEVE